MYIPDSDTFVLVRLLNHPQEYSDKRETSRCSFIWEKRNKARFPAACIKIF